MIYVYLVGVAGYIVVSRYVRMVSKFVYGRVFVVGGEIQPG